MSPEKVVTHPGQAPGGAERRDEGAREARNRLGAWLNVEPIKLREVEREPAQTMVMLTDAFEEATRRVLEEEARARELSRRVEALEDLVRTDHLTGIANRRGTEERLEMEWSRAQRHGHDLSVIALDCDNLKRVNDSLGHSAGDALLREVATRLASVVRAGDLVGRIGGDEFLVVCPHTDHEGVALAAHKIVTSTAWQLPGGTDPQPISVSVSAGWSTAQGHATWRELVLQADQALYAAKRRRGIGSN